MWIRGFRLLVIILLVVILGAVGFFWYKTSTVNWKELAMKGCGTRHPEISYSVNVPVGTSFTKIAEDKGSTEYQISASNLELKVSCDTAGVGSINCVEGGVRDIPFKVNSGHSTEGCFWSESLSGQYKVGEVYKVGNDQGSIIFYVTKADKTVVDQILSTFKLGQ